jgi:hypothetical protein
MDGMAGGCRGRIFPTVPRARSVRIIPKMATTSLDASDTHPDERLFAADAGHRLGRDVCIETPVSAGLKFR